MIFPSEVENSSYGIWIQKPDGEWSCDSCGYELWSDALCWDYEGTPFDYDFIFCPHCGKRMRWQLYSKQTLEEFENGKC